MATLNLASVPQSDSEKFFQALNRPISTEDLIDSRLFDRGVLEDEPEHDDTEWQDFLGYHDEVRR